MKLSTVMQKPVKELERVLKLSESQICDLLFRDTHGVGFEIPWQPKSSQTWGLELLL